jgi:hypothetical protein
MEGETGRLDVEAGDGVDGARAVHSVDPNEGADDSRDPRGSLSEERQWRTSVESGESQQRISVLQRVATLQRSSSAQLPRTSGGQMQRTSSGRLSVQQEQNAEMQERVKMNRDRCLMSTTLVIGMGLLLVYTLYIIFLAS